MVFYKLQIKSSVTVNTRSIRGPFVENVLIPADSLVQSILHKPKLRPENFIHNHEVFKVEIFLNFWTSCSRYF